MDILRERETSLLVDARERNSVAANGHSPATAGQSHVRNGHRSASEFAGNSQSPVVSLNPVSPAEDRERFRPDFHDPLFPRKQVPYATAKRIFDLTVAILVLILASPIMVVAALLVKLTSRGPILFKQVRVGEGGRYFWCYKFRSMCVDAEEKKAQLMHLNEASGPVFKMKKDPRVTPVGAILRKYSIDELPQLFNVIKGDMSIVGPRPPIPSEVEKYTEFERGRLAVKPGLTCLWQVSGRSNISFERWVQLDLLYIDTMSLKNDIKILFQTIPAVLKGSGAH
ncbi:MAG: sugar transferase [Chloroherpetonaceae bacterium]|nr:sugar transferase [Chthonomonadaceae bacterium]MDW8208056.1 sugar transferase [Chloroherpetonaceae bacterium]